MDLSEVEGTGVLFWSSKFWAWGGHSPFCPFCLPLAFQVGAECHDHQQQYHSPHCLLPWVGGFLPSSPSLLLSSLPLPISHPPAPLDPGLGIPPHGVVGLEVFSVL